MNAQAAKIDDIQHQWRIIAGIEKSQTEITAVLKSIVTRLEKVETNVASAAKIPWGAVGVSMAAITFVLGGFAALLSYTYSSNLNHVVERVMASSEVVRLHMANGHPGNVIEKVESLRETVENIESHMKTVVPRTEHVQRYKLIDERNDITTARLQRLQAQIDHLASRKY